MKRKLDEPPIKLRAPEYDRAWAHVLHEAIQGLVSHDPVMGMLGRVETEHGGPVRNVRTPEPLDQPIRGAELMATMDPDAVRATNVEKHTQFVAEMTDALLREVGPQLFESIAAITSATGMDEDAKGQPFSADLFLRTLEKLEIAFDDTGQPLLPTLVVPPALGETAKNALQTAQHDPRYHEILSAKRDAYFAAKRTRRLS